MRGVPERCQSERTEGSDYHHGTTLDQIAAQQIGPETQLPSLELAMATGAGGAVRRGLRLRIPEQHLLATRRSRCRRRPIRGPSSSVSSATAGAPPIPRGARQDERSLLDWVTEEIESLQNHARRGPIAPRSASISTRFARSSGASRRPRSRTAGHPLPDGERPVGVPAEYAEHAKLMFDLQVLAHQGDMTRVITFMLAPNEQPHLPTRSAWTIRTIPARTTERPEKMAKVSKINRYHMSLFAYYLEKLRSNA